MNAVKVSILQLDFATIRLGSEAGNASDYDLRETNTQLTRHR